MNVASSSTVQFGENVSVGVEHSFQNGNRRNEKEEDFGFKLFHLAFAHRIFNIVSCDLGIHFLCPDYSLGLRVLFLIKLRLLVQLVKTYLLFITHIPTFRFSVGFSSM